MDVAAALAVGVAAGVVAGALGIGGGVLFVPGLAIFLGLSQLEAEATSLLAMIPVAVVGAWRQHRYGNLRAREGALVGALAAGGALLGVAIANAVPERALELGFALFMVVVAGQLVRRAVAESTPAAGRR
ncbi:MAG: sulfite exporter TauE/SafE family protein [Actinomycetota bacterium]|nr:sulfite exporter TauE/SafE family protein [Actinomycetota bacterium]